MLVTVLFHRRKKGIQYSLEWHECKFWQNFIFGWTQAHFIPDSSPTQVMFMSLSCSLSHLRSHPDSYYCLSTKMAKKNHKNKNLHDTSECSLATNQSAVCSRPQQQWWISVSNLIKLWDTPIALCLEFFENKTSCVNGSLLILCRLLSVSVVWRATLSAKTWQWWYIKLQS